MRKRVDRLHLQQMSGWIAAIVIVGSAASCTVSATPTPPSSTDSPGPSAAVSAPSPSPSQTPFAHPSLPAGKWTAIHWTKVTGMASVWTWIPGSGSTGSAVIESGWNVFGWSRGYVAFDTVNTSDDDSWTEVTTTQHSTDGVHWEVGGQFSQTGSAEDYSYVTSVDGIREVVDGPAGLLAVGHGEPDCGGRDWAWPIAVSSDGITWRSAVTELANQMLTIDGGTAGYIATGTNAIFTSTDGRAWNTVEVKAKAFKGLVELESGTAFAGGFVASGEANTPDYGCETSASFLAPSLWWSPDGKTWTRDKVPNATPGSGVQMFVCHFDDHIVVAGEYPYGTAKASQWASTDGRTWKSMPTPDGSVLCPSDSGNVLTNGDRAVVVTDSGSIYSLSDDLKVAKLTETGDVPPDEGNQTVLGPAGFITTDNNGDTYIGMPVAG